MKKFMVVEPVVALFMFLYSMPLTQQYVYWRLWEDITNSTFDNDNASHCHVNQSDPTFLKQKEVQEKVSIFILKTELCAGALSILVAFVVVANGERWGRKVSLVLPMVGSLVSTIFLCAISYFSLPLSLLFISAFITGLFGSLATFLGGAFSFIADLCENEKQNTIRIAVIDFILGVASGLGGLSSGYILKALDFTWTYVVMSLLHVVNILYVMCFLDDTVRVSDDEPKSLKEKLKETFSGVYDLFRKSPCRKRTLIALLLCTFMTYLFIMIGALSLYTIYELNAPLCWNAIYIGYGSAASTVASLIGFLGILVLVKYLKDFYLVYLGIFSYIGGAVMAAFANTTLLMLLVRVPSLLLAMPIPVLRSMLSKLVLPNEQGAIFACIACLEVVMGTLGLVTFNSLYAVTVGWFPGFSFLFSAGLCIIPLSTLSWFLYATWHEYHCALLINEEDSLGENADS
ncbi:lysosomal proton-coupled steroid conjugate and bile acid symporter SLC46A3 [Zootoca vivipara]|uniref:lysosomal proton-coupled steroid conjugate and bile acid symporter SLC46A3 n=1 Tax=Zootoca vivipara TaxID=8524 RepID=UPI00293BE9FE|nr:lysosomal proton-coupled steroid conjugate and bile acid symporter SLC46A3 [Zootoca vivipara]XP_060129798.1 lysosomal proton-coupled steroid conjugate and bile acid symporter SLC46A3 [Zootoca vivipara]XP_060129799.1 lysosomal proton-coupled steroid conjugate and bile acid symporter SLC46A3 [Zootoca vivipara]